MTIQVRIETHHGVLDRELDLPAGEVTLAVLARAVLPLASDVETLAARRAAESGRPATCAKGCGACCRQLVTVSPAEAWMIRELVDHLPEPERAAAEGRFEAAREALLRSGLIETLCRLNDPALDAEAHYAIAARYFRLGLACPFLDGSGACSIHARRPALCREYLAGSPPAWCADPFATTPRRLPLAAEVSQALLGLSAQLLRHELEPIPLALAPEWAREHASDGRKTWDGKRLLERFLLHLEVSIGQIADGAIEP